MSRLRPSALPLTARLARLLLLPALLVVAACDPGAMGVTRGTPGTVKIALLLPEGDPDPRLASITAGLSRAAQLAVADTGGQSVELATYATAGNPTQAAAAARKAVEEGADVIVGPFRGETSVAAARAVAGDGIAVLSFSNNAEIAGGNLFVLGYTFQNTANQLGNYAARNGVRQVMVVNGRHPAEQIIRDAAVQGLAGTGVRVVATADFGLSQEGVQAALPGIVQSARDSGAQGILLTSDTYAALPTITSMLRDAGLGTDAMQFMGVTRWNEPPSATALPGLQGGWFAMPDPGRLNQFESRYTSAYSAIADDFSVLAYDAVNAVAVQAGKSGAAGVKPAGLVGGGTFAGAAGPFRFQRDGTVLRGLAIAAIRDNRVMILQSAPSRLGGAGS